jgi:hypothetical protein
MLPRALVAATLVLSCFLGLSCDSKEAEHSSADVWAEMFPMGSSIDELAQQTSFKLLLPSYLPQEMRIYDASGDQTAGGIVWLSKENSWEASISISPFPSRWAELDIEITERQRQADDLRIDPPPFEELTTIGQTTVTCSLQPHELLMTPPPTPEQLIIRSSDGTSISIVRSPGSALAPSYLCLWDTDKLHISVEFLWSFSDPLPGLITSSHRDQAMKVVASMIEEPYIP